MKFKLNYLARAEGSHLEGTAFLTSSARISGNRSIWTLNNIMKYPSRPKYFIFAASLAHDPLSNPNIELNNPDGIFPGPEHFWLMNSDIYFEKKGPFNFREKNELSDEMVISWVHFTCTNLIELEDIGLIPRPFALVAFDVDGDVVEWSETRYGQLSRVGFVDHDEPVFSLAIFESKIGR